MQQEMINDIINIIKKQKLEDILRENRGIRKAYCQKILVSDPNFFVKAINNNLYDYLKKFYILKKEVEEQEQDLLKSEEMEIIKKYVIYLSLKSLDKNTLEKLKSANDILQHGNLNQKVEKNKELRDEIISFIKKNDENFYNSYLENNNNLNDEDVQIKMVQEYNEYLKKIS